MNINELENKIRNNEMILNTNGHNIDKEIFFERSLNQIKYERKRIKKGLSYIKSENDDINKLISFICDDIYCRHCGKISYRNEKLEMINDELAIVSKNSETCRLPEIKPVSCEHTFMDSVSFFNYVENVKDAEEKDEYTNDFSLNYPLGRKNIQEYLSTKNIGYGQTENTGIHFYVKKDKSEILIHEYEIYKGMIKGYGITNQKYIDFINYILENFDYITKMHCAVWRYMFCETSDIDKNGYKVQSDFYKEKETNHYPVKIKPGKWIHTYHGMGSENGIIATLKLVE